MLVLYFLTKFCYLKEILLYNQPHTESQGKPRHLLLIRFIQMYPIRFEAFEHDFVVRD